MDSDRYDHFTGDFSAEGTFVVEAQKSITRGSSKKIKEYKKVNVTVPLWSGVKIVNGELKTDDGKKFVCCQIHKSLEVFIEKEEFEKRLANDANADKYKTAYKADWDTAGDGLSCKAWLEDGGFVGEGKSAHWPARGFKVKDNYDEQRKIWWTIALKEVNVGAGRLWSPVKPLSRKIELFFAPVSDTITFTDLKKALDAIVVKEQDKVDRKKSSMLDWMTPKAVEKGSKDLEGKALLSQNLLKHYETYISLQDLQLLIEAQSEGGKSWERAFPSKEQAEAFQKAMLDKSDNEKWKGHLEAGVVASTSTIIDQNKSFGNRIDAKAIMGKQSANQWGNLIWLNKEGDDQKKFIAEWLHRSAYSFGYMSQFDFQSPQNIIFGTYQANSDMTRAETVIRLLRDDEHMIVKGELATFAVNKDEIFSVDYSDGQQKPLKLDSWIGEKNYSWLVPELQYQGGNFADHSLTNAKELDVYWFTNFQTFSLYAPLTIEGSLDRALTKEYLAKVNWSTGSDDPAAKKTKKTEKPKLSSAPPPDANAGASQHPLIANAPAQVTPTTQATAPQAAKVHPRHVLAWNAIAKGKDHVQLGDLKLRKPTQVLEDKSSPPSGSPQTTPPPEGFVLSGEIDLFGLTDRVVSLQSWHGPPPASLEVGSDVPVYQHVTVDKIKPASFIPLLVGTPLADFEFSNTLITYQNYGFEPTKPVGWSLVADIVIGANHGALYKVLHDACGVSALDVKVMASLGMGHSWAKKPDVSDFAFRGILQIPTDPKTKETGIALCSGITITRVGINVFGVGTTSLGMNPKRSMKYGFGISGEMHIDLPGSVTPSVFDFHISEFGGTARLHASIRGNVWKNAFGTGIDLESVTLSASFSTSQLLKSLVFDFSARLRTNTWTAKLKGHFASKTDYSISAVVDNMGFDGVVDLFHHVSGDSVAVPEHCEVTIGSASIVFDHADGLTIAVDHLAFDKYSSANAKVHIDSNGVVIHGDVANIDFPEFDLQIVSAYVDVSLVKSGSSKSSDIALGGIVKVKGMDSVPEISANVHLYKESANKPLEWTVYGTFTALGNTTTLGKLLPVFHGTFLENLALQNLAFVAASKDEPALSAMNPHQLPIKQGIQIVAVLGEVDPFTKLLRTKSFPGLTLSGQWSNSAFSLGVLLSTDTFIHLGHGITTDPIELAIQTNPIDLRISTGVSVPVAGSKEPLDFKASLSVLEETVALEGEMKGLWKNPFGISPNVVVGPLLALQLEINLLLFPATGLPSAFGFAGGVAIGNTESRASVQISDDPSQELLVWELEHLSVVDLTRFLGEVIEKDVPAPPDFLDFEKVSLYMSSGVTIGTTSYPAGFSFSANLKIFGITLHSSASIVNKCLAVAGSIESLSVGPLAIKGHQGKDATLSISLGPSQQSVFVDGAISLLGLTVALTVQLQILPKPSFSFQFMLQFTDFLVFSVDAQTIGDHVDLKHLGDLDFSLHAVFEQHLVEYIRDQIVSSLEKLKKGINGPLDEDKKKVAEEKAKLEAGISSAQAQLDRDYKSWIQHSNEIHASSQKVIDDYMARLHGLQTAVDNERLAFNQKMKDAEGAVQHANAVRADKMRDAQAAVTNAKSKWDNDVAQKERELEAARQKLNSKFGHAEQDIEEAKHKVDGINSSIKGTQDKINDYKNAHWYEVWKKAAIPELYVALGALEASKAIADGVLSAAEAVLRSADYVACNGAIPLLEKAVEDVGKVGNALYNTALQALKEADLVSAKLVSDAEGALELFQKGGDALLKKAQAALDDFVRVSQAILNGAQKAIDDLVKSAEWLAYQAASAALSTAQHATHGLDVATAALTAIEKGADGIIDVAVEVVEAALNAFNITKVELGGTFKALIGADTKHHFIVSITGEVVGKPFQFEDVPLDLTNTKDFVHDIFVRLVDFVKSKK